MQSVKKRLDVEIMLDLANLWLGEIEFRGDLHGRPVVVPEESNLMDQHLPVGVVSVDASLHHVRSFRISRQKERALARGLDLSND